MIEGNVIKYGDDINTDVIFPGRCLAITEPDEMAEHAMEDLDADFPEKVKNATILVVGKNFGCGSSREQAATCLKYAGVEAIVAKSFARIFYRNAINQGIPIIECPKAVDEIDEGDKLEINVTKGELIDITKDKSFKFQPLPYFIQKIISAGGLIPYLKNNL